MRSRKCSVGFASLYFTITLGVVATLGVVTILAVVPAVAAGPDEGDARLACGCGEFGLAVEKDIRFERTYTGNYRPGEPYDYITVDPAGTGETLADVGITVRVRIFCGQHLDPLANVPASQIVLFNGDLCMCPPWISDAGTDADGWAEFSGTVAAGGCAQGLDLYGDGYYITTIPVNINSTDSGMVSPCFTDSADLAALASMLGDPEQWDICFDYNESGPPTIDASDLAYFTSRLGAACR